ncbi:ornithine cyclodeaminase family protein [Streptomyces cinnamoneus]|uniref:ornithine cyclodeaminase family protein n=1 Tax=Streptomyces cinnamoneus TaxID=53446 RepID=UPI001EFE77AD|nr:ornithine cyclodeaminase family protein [Streptomyces cinnamoneus]
MQLVGRDTLMDRMIDRMACGIAALGRGEVEPTPRRGGFTRDSDGVGVIEWMPHHEPGKGMTLKTVGYTPSNPTNNDLPTILGTVARYDDVTGQLVALADGVVPTAIRTGAMSAVASRLLARPDSTTVGLIGAGAQSVTQLHALSRVFDVRRVLVHDIDPEHTASFASRVAFLGPDLDIQLVTAERVAAESDVICTATTVGVGEGPVLPDTVMRDHVHVNAVGADLPGKTELSAGLLARSLVTYDHLGQARVEGECQQLPEDAVGPSLASLCADPGSALPWRERSTVFDSTGFAFEDHLALDLFLELAIDFGLGQTVEVEYHPVDSLDPYPPLVDADSAAGVPVRHAVPSAAA